VGSVTVPRRMCLMLSYRPLHPNGDCQQITACLKRQYRRHLDGSLIISFW
jgi:hypothetical protein